jgi:hypothetical protein
MTRGAMISIALLALIALLLIMLLGRHGGSGRCGRASNVPRQILWLVKLYDAFLE